MFYLILAMLLVLFYIFAAPNNIRGTINLMVAVFVLVALFIALLLVFFKGFRILFSCLGCHYHVHDCILGYVGYSSFR